MSLTNSVEALHIWHNISLKMLKLAPYDLSSRQIGILLNVYLTPAPHTVKNLSESLSVSKPAICRAIDSLSKKGFIKRKKDDTDRRIVYLQRTIKGSVFLSEFGDIILDALKKA